MDALRRAEAEKKNAAARASGLPIEPEATTGELRLEPLETSTERPLRSLVDDTLYDQQAAPTRQQMPRGAATRDGLLPELGVSPSPFLTAPVGPGSAAQPTVVSAQTVFEATRGGGLPRGLVAVIVCTGLLAAGLTAVGLYAYRQTPQTRPIPSPKLAAQLEAPPSLPALATPAPVASSPPPLPQGAAVTTPLAEEPAPVAAEPVDNTPVVAPAPVAAPTPSPIETATAVAPTPAMLSAAPLERALAGDIPRDAEITSGEVRIARQAKGSAAPDTVTRAYGAFQLGQIDTARRLYQEVLARDPERTDARLGLAAIAMREGRLAEAHRWYRDVLRQEPRHPVASAALFMIEGGAGNEITEARLKLLADNDADSPYLRFALGNLYARQKRWADAQEAYFAAFSRAPANGDYAYNLAVSLDQLGQRKAALEYYRKALALRQAGAAGFDVTRATARVAALAGAP